VINEVTVVGSRCGHFPPALQALAQARIAVTPLIDAMYPLTAGEAAVMHAARPETLKILLQQRP
jgi:threonine dehydrogenase-like Zn-dependent dehydrogenase